MSEIKFPEIGLRLEACLQTKGLSKAELARKTGIPPPTITRYLKGQMRPVGDHLITLTQYFGITPDWLYGKEKGEKKAKLGVDEEEVGLLDLQQSDISSWVTFMRDVEKMFSLIDSHGTADEKKKATFELWSVYQDVLKRMKKQSSKKLG